MDKVMCQFCGLESNSVLLGLEHLQKAHLDKYEAIYRRYELKAKPEPVCETISYKAYIAKLWAEYVPDDE